MENPIDLDNINEEGYSPSEHFFLGTLRNYLAHGGSELKITPEAGLMRYKSNGEDALGYAGDLERPQPETGIDYGILLTKGRGTAELEVPNVLVPGMLASLKTLAGVSPTAVNKKGHLKVRFEGRDYRIPIKITESRIFGTEEVTLRRPKSIDDTLQNVA